ncbi:MAG TPA: calcium-binding protein, partial [Afifellaceae bacterium]|nr:calcium-binding protein [Afifellaceae bacterium]
NGGKKNDVLHGTPGNDAILGKDGNDSLFGHEGDDYLSGGNGDDYLEGNAGNDRLFGSSGMDTLLGGDGNDELQGGDGYDELNGGDGFDVAFYSADDYSIEVTVLPDGDGDGFSDGFNVHFRQVTLGNGDLGPPPIADEQALNIEAIVGTYYDDVMTGADIAERDPSSLSPDGFVNIFDGYYGNDSLTGGDGRDCIYGGGDDDSIDGAGGDDELHGGSGNDSISGGMGDDLISGGSNAWWEAPDQDTIDGGAGMDTIIGGGGPDDLTGGADADTFVYLSASEGGDTINDFSGSAVGLNGDMIDLTALNLDGGGKTVAQLLAGGFLFLVDGDKLYVDLDGGGPGEMTDPPDPVPIFDDVLIAIFTDGGGGFDINNDVLV